MNHSSAKQILTFKVRGMNIWVLTAITIYLAFCSLTLTFEIALSNAGAASEGTSLAFKISEWSIIVWIVAPFLPWLKQVPAWLVSTGIALYVILLIFYAVQSLFYDYLYSEIIPIALLDIYISYSAFHSNKHNEWSPTLPPYTINGINIWILFIITLYLIGFAYIDSNIFLNEPSYPDTGQWVPLVQLFNECLFVFLISAGVLLWIRKTPAWLISLNMTLYWLISAYYSIQMNRTISWFTLISLGLITAYVSYCVFYHRK